MEAKTWRDIITFENVVRINTFAILAKVLTLTTFSKAFMSRDVLYLEVLEASI